MNKLKDWHVLILIILLALSVRTGILVNTYHNAPHCGTATQLFEAARNLYEGRGYVVNWSYVENVTAEELWQARQIDFEEIPPPENGEYEPYFLLPPGTSAIQAFTFMIFGKYHYIYSRVLQMVIDCFGCIFMFLTARLLWNRKVGIIAAILYAMWFPIAYVSTWALHDAMMPFFVSVALYFFVKGIKELGKNHAIST